MRRRADLHTHTTASDGQYTPRQLVCRARAAGIGCLAITDHDTTGGLDEGLRAGAELGLTVIPGVELGAKEDRHLHILGLGFGAEHPALEALCRTLQASRAERKFRIVDFLREKGMDIPLAEVEALAGGGLVARPHFARVMLERGYVSSLREAFDRYLDTEEYQTIERFKAEAKDCIAAIHADGGKTVLAHPCQLGYPDEKLEALLAQLKEVGLDALECHYPQHTRAQTAWYLKLANMYGLHVTAGSDFHGERVKPDVSLMPTELELDWLL
ncbi:PHP domain-containing protein [Flavonifractor sp. An306]|uniref:PHP domain-containing protein n=1 Tax=Flavonifractor sp. An306 TaxID=1965629 RepID=UPI0017493011|nr:PHP domain-containing protein [Flavonifractor sp. An306]